MSIEDKILNVIQTADKGNIYFIEDFLAYGNTKAIGKALERLVDKSILNRISRGMYAHLKEHKEFGKIYPTIEKIAQAVARRDKARIIRTGIWAQYALGLSTQIPLKAVYLTDGSAREIQIDKRSIRFKKTAPRNLATVGPISGLAIQALKSIGKEQLIEQEENLILKHLAKERKENLQHDVKLAPEWIRIIMRKALKDKVNEAY